MSFFFLDFYPYFKIVDETTGESWNFTEDYTLKVVGGSPYSKEDIVEYGDDLVFEYNNQNRLKTAILHEIRSSSSEV